MICIFDIETIPDVFLLRKLYPDLSELSDLDLCQKVFHIQEEKTGSSFLPISQHKIVAISSVIADEFGHFIKVGNFGKQEKADHPDYEKILISDFISYLNKQNPKLVSYNGRNFDLPTIMLRAMRYNLSATAYFESDNPKFNKTKWENYRQRYSERFHTDLLDTLGHFGSVRGLKLDEVCNMLDIPGKYDMSGDLVHMIYFDTHKDISEKMNTIETYCQSDVLNTYWVYLKYELLKGDLSLEDYYRILQGFLEKIPQNKSYTEIFMQALNKELKNVSLG